MSTRQRFILIRHAATRSNIDGIWHGQQDEPLSRDGLVATRNAAARLVRILDGSRATLISSNYQRAIQTSLTLSSELCLAFNHIFSGLGERDMGEWSGKSPSETEIRYPGLLERWEKGLVPGPPSGETDQEVARRAMQVLLACRPLDIDVVIVVTHGGVVRSLLNQARLPKPPVPHLGGYWATVEQAVLKIGPPIGLGQPQHLPLT